MIEKLMDIKIKTFSTLAQNKKFTVEVVNEVRVVVRVINRLVGAKSKTSGNIFNCMAQ
jgi:hypothetical protein